MLKHDIGFFKASDSIHLNPYESQLSSASDKYNPSYPRLLMLNLGKYSADAPLHNRANDINLKASPLPSPKGEGVPNHQTTKQPNHQF